jgi:hypothetical protein
MAEIFQRYDSFEDIATEGLRQVGQAGASALLNFMLQARFGATLLREPQLLDVAAKAELWQRHSTPPELYFSHGQYIREDGLLNLISELRQKTDSNRAVVSLISQNDIVGSGDRPLPHS